jgi:hypothetical protein
MHKAFIISMLLISIALEAQNNIHYNFTVNTTFMANENFGKFDDDTDEIDWNIIVPRALLLRNGFDVTLNNWVSVGLNLGFDLHEDLDVMAIPYYIDSKFTILKDGDDRLYIGGGYGKLIKLSNAFDSGKYYKAGIGYQAATEKAHSFIMNIDFHQKKIEHVENGRINSLSFGLGMSFF